MKTDNLCELSFKNIWNAIKSFDLYYLCFLFKRWYIGNLEWRILRNVFNQKCGNCRNWHYKGKFSGKEIGKCDFLQDLLYETPGWCPCWNIDLDANDYTTDEDGWERVFTTPAGKEIIQVSRSGIWMYVRDGKFNDM